MGGQGEVFCRRHQPRAPSGLLTCEWSPFSMARSGVGCGRRDAIRIRLQARRPGLIVGPYRSGLHSPFAS